MEEESPKPDAEQKECVLSKSQQLNKEMFIDVCQKDKKRTEKLRALDVQANLSVNSIEMVTEKQFNFHSLERIRQESGGS